MQIDHTCRGEFVVTSVIGELDTPDAPEAWTEMIEVLDFSPKGVVLDLGGCTYIASAGISLIVRLVQQLRPLHAPVRIANVSPRLKMVLDTVNLPSLVPVDATIDDALGKLARVAAHVPAA
ncbi:MAG: STAS domain-containing protein [Phycisphaerae bacterium]